VGAVERLHLAFLVDRQHDGVRGRIDIKPNDVVQFGDEVRIVGELELPDAMRLKSMGTPNALNRTDGDTGGLCHHRASPVRRFARWVLKRQGNDPLGDLLAQRRDAGRARLVAKQAVEACLHEPRLPASDASLGLAGAAHDLVRADAIGRERDDFRPPRVLLGGVAVSDETLKPFPIRGRRRHGYSRAHLAESHAPTRLGIHSGIQLSEFIH
jgi:hypothetical protein